MYNNIMLQFYDNLNNLIIKHNPNCGNTINLLCDNLNINEKLNNLYNPVKITINSDMNEIKSCFTVIFIDDLYDETVTKYINTILQKNIKICLIVKLHFNFDKFVKKVNSNDIEAISWIENDKKCEYYFIVL